VVDLEAAEHDWEISPGMVVHGYAFNGQAPGPVIEASVGDTLQVRFTNRLPERTTIRWHGVRLPAAMGLSELDADPVPPGGRFQYQFHLTDAGTFWYHSQMNATTQSKRNPCGVLVVRNGEELAFDGERVLLFDDLRLSRREQLAAPAQLLEDIRRLEGQCCSSTGSESLRCRSPTGQVERWRLVNTASANHLQLSLGGHRFHVIGTDGPAPHAVDEVLMTHGDRFDVAVGPFPVGETVVLEALAFDRSARESPRRTLASLHVTPQMVLRRTRPSAR
jgi:FtsP/CotA-like multicopper oxidase with cupredoxin domain